MHNLPPLALYVHFPWCVRKCPYCDFNSHPLAADGDLPEQAYITQLLADLAADVAWAGTRPLHSIFMGGGTPSLISGAGITRLLQGIAALLPLTSDTEITLEANPGTLDTENFFAYRQAGVNRLSIGVQSFQAEKLKALGRIHDPAAAHTAAALAQQAGFTRINLDLMHGLPGQSVADAMADLSTAIKLGVEHISWYQLTLEPKTEFARRPPALPEEEVLAGIESAGLALLATAGYQRYEVSAYAQPGAMAKHNLNYWQFGDYLGIGAGAMGKLSFLDAAGNLNLYRTSKPSQPRLYQQTSATALRQQQAVPPAQRTGEFMLNALRLQQGFPLALFGARTGLPLSSIASELAQLQAEGLVVQQQLQGDTWLVLTPLGQRFLDTLVSRFL